MIFGCLSLSFLEKTQIVRSEDDIIVTVNEFRADVISGGAWKGNDYVWDADSSNANHGFAFRITFSLSGTYDFEAGGIVITVPKSILLDKEGQSIGGPL